MEIIKTRNGETRFKEKVYLNDGTTKTKTFFRKTDALKWKQDVESNKRKDPNFNLKSRQKFNLFQLHKEWMSSKIYFKRDERTIYQYERFFISHLEKHFGSKNIETFHSSDFDKLMKQLVERGMKPKSVNNVLAFIKQIFKYAEDENLIKSNPLKKVKKISEPQRDFQYLLEDEIKVLLRSNRFEPIYPVLLIALNTGLRIGEIFGLCWDCINIERRQMVIKRTLSRKGLKESTKTKLIRVLPMNDAVLNLFRELLRNQKSSKFVFADGSGNALKPDHFSSREFKRALDRADIKRIRFHDLRHTYASNYMMKGGNLYDLQKLLGHTKSETTNVYAHLAPEHLQEAAKVINFEVNDDSTSDLSKLNSPYLALAE